MKTISFILFVVFTSISFASVDLRDVKIFSSNPSKTIKILKEANIHFKDSLQVQGTTFYLSQIFKFGDHIGGKEPLEKRLGFFYIVETAKKNKFLRFAYQSRTHGLFRVAPFIVYYGGFSVGSGQDVLTVTWLSKGVGEGSLGLPGPVQLRVFNRINNEKMQLLHLSVVLNSIASINEKAPEEGDIAEFYRKVEEKKKKLKALMAKEVTLDGSILDKSKFVTERRKFVYKGEEREDDFINPSSISLVEKGLTPNYSAVSSPEITTTHKYYGEINVESYTSFDRSIEYLVFRDALQRVWFARTEVKNSQLTTYGVYAKAIADDESPLTLPLFERKKKIHPDYYVLDGRAESYSRYSSWGYLKNIDLIKTYYSAKCIDIPLATYSSTSSF